MGAKRYIVMSIPGSRDDGSDTWWFVFDTRRHRSVPDAELPGNGLPGRGGQIAIARTAKWMNQRPPALRKRG